MAQSKYSIFVMKQKRNLLPFSISEISVKSNFLLPPCGKAELQVFKNPDSTQMLR